MHCLFWLKTEIHTLCSFRGRENDDAQMLIHAGVKDGAKISIAEKNGYREEQASVQAAQEQEALLQKQQAAAVQQVNISYREAKYAVCGKAHQPHSKQ